MESALFVLERCFWVYAAIDLIFLLGFFFSIKSAMNSNGAFRTIALGICFVAILVSVVIPCGMDCCKNNVIQVRGIYRNADVSKSHSGLMGIQSVILEVDDGNTIHLTTPIFSSAKKFPIGEYEVVAYYSQKTRILLCIDVINVE